jgi:hypothetical protein
MIYSDAYSVFAGARHPQLLGQKVLSRRSARACNRPLDGDVGLL